MPHIAIGPPHCRIRFHDRGRPRTRQARGRGVPGIERRAVAEEPGSEDGADEWGRTRCQLARHRQVANVCESTWCGLCRRVASPVCSAPDDRAGRGVIRRRVRLTPASSTRLLPASPGATRWGWPDCFRAILANVRGFLRFATAAIWSLLPRWPGTQAAHG